MTEVDIYIQLMASLNNK